MTSADIPATQDTHIDAGNVNTNYGTATALLLTSSDPKRILLKFPLSIFTIYDVVNVATLELECIATSNSGDIVIHATTSVWDGATVTWTLQPTVGGMVGTDGNAAVPGPWTCDLTAHLAALIAAGAAECLLEIRFSPETGSDTASFQSNEGSPPLPNLAIDYTPATAPVDEPTTLSAVGGLNKVNLTWIAPTDNGGAPLTNYKIYRGTTPSGETLHDTISAPATTYEDTTTITPGQTYYYKVSAVNAIGEGPSSSEASDAPFDYPGAPTALDSDSHASTSVNLTWTAPANNGGSAITNYRVYKGTQTGVLTAHGYVGSNATSYNVIGLTQGTTYFFAVAAVTAVGEGDQSSETSEYPSVPPGAPTALTSAISDEHADLTWSPPSSTGGSAITGYKLYIGGVLVHTIATPTASFTDTGLTNGTTYTYTVKATNRDGDSSASSGFAYIPGAAPHAPTGLVITPTFHHMYLYWTAADANGYAISAYRIYRGTVTGALTLLASTTAVYYLDTTILSQNQDYFYQVSAVNAQGESAKTAESDDQTLVPSHPTNRMMVTIVYLETQSGYNKYSERTYNTAIAIDGKIEPKSSRIRATGGEVIFSKCRIFIDGSISISVGDRLTVSSEALIVLHIEKVYDAAGTVAHQVVYT